MNINCVQDTAVELLLSEKNSAARLLFEKYWMDGT